MTINIEQFFDKASQFKLEYDEVVTFTERHGLSLVDFVNAFALELAKGYRQQDYNFEFSDNAINWLFGFMTHDVFSSTCTCEDLPSPAFDVYLAFDEGEYNHPSDSADVDPIEKYTNPALDDILRHH